MQQQSTPSQRFDSFISALISAIGHSDRDTPLRDYCSGLLLPGDRKSVEPMAARIDPYHVQAKHQSMHHFIANAPWSDEAVLQVIAEHVVPVLEINEPIEAWVVDDTGIPKKGKHSVGVARQYCGRLGKQDNCQVAVSVSLAHTQASLPVAYRLYLPEEWTEDPKRRSKCGVPEHIWFQTKPTLAMSLIEKMVERNLPRGVVLADAGYGNDSLFRYQLSELNLRYSVALQASTRVWQRGMEPPMQSSSNKGPRRMHVPRDPKYPPVSVLALALKEGESVFETVQWREGSAATLSSRFWATRVRSAHRVPGSKTVAQEEWLLVEWPQGAPGPTKFWLSTLPEDTPLRRLVHITKMRWRIERDYEELKSEIGLGHFEGRGWRGFHHHASICIAAYAFLVAERGLFPPEERPKRLPIRKARIPARYRPRGATNPTGKTR